RVKETNTFGIAYLRLDLLPADAQPRLREYFRKYLLRELPPIKEFPISRRPAWKSHRHRHFKPTYGKRWLKVPKQAVPPRRRRAAGKDEVRLTRSIQFRISDFELLPECGFVHSSNV